MILDPATGTSSGVPANPMYPGLITIGGALASFDFTSAIRPAEWASIEQTNSGAALSTASEPITERHTTDDAIAELRRLSGLTWEQLAQIFGVARRSLHFWASGKPLASSNEERLYRLLGVARAIDRGSPRTNRRLLVSALSNGQIPLDLLANEQFDAVIQELGVSETAATPPPKVSQAVLKARRPPPPDQRVGALHDTVHEKPGGRRTRRAARLRKK